MVEPADQALLRSIFLMEAWDTLAAVQEGVARLAGGREPAWDDLFVVTHRLKGAASLHGFHEASRLADTVERALHALRHAAPATRRAAAAELTALAAALEAVLDTVEHRGPEPPPMPGVHAGGRAAIAALARPEDPVRRDLLRFFAAGDEVLAYFGPEAAEHLEAMTGALLALEREPAGEAELAALFRAVHTLKGAAYVVGCTQVGALAHRLEDLLGAVRAGRAPLTPSVLEVGLAAVDTLKHMLDPAADPALHLTTAVEGLRARVAALLDASPPAGGEPVATPPARRSPVAATPPGVRAGAAAGPRQTIRVALDRLDRLMDLVGELVTARSALERRFGDLDRLDDVLFASRARLGQAVTDFERRRLDARLSGRRGAGAAADDSHAPPRPVAELFAELELDRDDDVTLLARSMAEIAADIAEVQAEIADLGRTVREDLAHVHRVTGALRAGLGQARMVPIGALYTRFVRQAQEAARTAGKSVRIATSGESVELDAGIIEQIVDPLLHLVQNAVVHGLESPDERIARGKPAAGTVTLSASHRGAFVLVEVADDGRGIDTERLRRQAVAQGLVPPDGTLTEREALELIFRPGFSTATEITAVAGRGVGMDVVRTNVGRVSGEVAVDTVLGAGTRFTLRLPLTVLVTEALLVRAGSEVLAVPLNAVHATAPLGPRVRRTDPDGEAALVEGCWLPLLHLDRALGLPADPAEAPPGVIMRAPSGLFACAVTQVLHREEIVVKPLGAFLDGIGPYAGATLAADGRVILLLDPVRLGELARRPPAGQAATARGIATTHTDIGRDGPPSGPAALRKGNVLLVDDSISVRKFVGQMLEKAGFAVTTASDGTEALGRLGERAFDVMVTDLEMPRLNGYELLEDVRRRPGTRALPVVILTTRAGAKHRSLAEGLGISHYVTKPVAEDVLVRLVESLALHGSGEARP